MKRIRNTSILRWEKTENNSFISQHIINKRYKRPKTINIFNYTNLLNKTSNSKQKISFTKKSNDVKSKSKTKNEKNPHSNLEETIK